MKATGSTTIKEADILRATEDALAALSTLLSEDEWFFGQEKPGLFDASVFAYTHLLLDKTMSWEENRLGQVVKGCQNLGRHRNRIMEMYY